LAEKGRIWQSRFFNAPDMWPHLQMRKFCVSLDSGILHFVIHSSPNEFCVLLCFSQALLHYFTGSSKSSPEQTKTTATIIKGEKGWESWPGFSPQWVLNTLKCLIMLLNDLKLKLLNFQKQKIFPNKLKLMGEGYPPMSNWCWG
jgi:hypothetical protein